MDFHNDTPFAPFAFESEDTERRRFGVVVLRGTFAIDRGKTLRPIPKQDDLVLADRYRGDTRTTSVVAESDLAPFKPRADVFIEAIAHAPMRRASPSWLVGARVGRIAKMLRVTGPRTFRIGLTGWGVSDAEPVLEVPIRYELAYGGRQRVGDVEHVYEQNPVGLGFVHTIESLRGVPAPQIEAHDEEIRSPMRRYVPQGFGPIARSWLPRRALAGTYDDAWLRDRWPALPKDFDFRHYNAAHPDLVYPAYLEGNEVVALEGLDVDGPLSFALPGYRNLRATVGLDDGTRIRAACVLDTLHIDVAARRAYLVWRARVRLDGDSEMEEIVADMDLPEGADGQS